MQLVKDCFVGTLDQSKVRFTEQSAAAVMLVSGGYPEAYKKNKKISIPSNQKGSLLFHAGTKMQDGKLLTNGGRVIAITSFHKHFKEAIKASMEVAEDIAFEAKNYRKDIGFDL